MCSLVQFLTSSARCRNVPISRGRGGCHWAKLCFSMRRRDTASLRPMMAERIASFTYPRRSPREFGISRPARQSDTTYLSPGMERFPPSTYIAHDRAERAFAANVETPYDQRVPFLALVENVRLKSARVACVTSCFRRNDLSHSIEQSGRTAPIQDPQLGKMTRHERSVRSVRGWDFPTVPIVMLKRPHPPRSRLFRADIEHLLKS